MKTYNDISTYIKNGNETAWSLVYSRAQAFPLEKYSIFKSLEDLSLYAKTNDLAYEGQIVAVTEGDKQIVYVLDSKCDNGLRRAGVLSVSELCGISDYDAKIEFLSNAISNDIKSLSNYVPLSGNAFISGDLSVQAPDQYGVKIGSDGTIFLGFITPNKYGIEMSNPADSSQLYLNGIFDNQYTDQCIIKIDDGDIATENFVKRNQTAIGKYNNRYDLSSKQLSVVKISEDDYQNLFIQEKLLSDAIYDISSNNINAYGQKIVNLAEPELITDAVTKNYVDTLLYGRLLSSNLSFNYDSETKFIYLKAFNNDIGTVNCADFIKDGMLSTVSLSGNTLVFVFNTDAGKTPISVNLSSFVDNYDAKIEFLSNAISNDIKSLSNYVPLSGNAFISGDLSVQAPDQYGVKIGSDGTIFLGFITPNKYGIEMSTPADWGNLYLNGIRDDQYTDQCIIKIDDGDIATENFVKRNQTKIGSYNNRYDLSSKQLSVIKISEDDYQNLFIQEKLLSDAIYDISSNNINAYGQKIVNLAEPELITDAVTKNYVDKFSLDILSSINKNYIWLSGGNNTENSHTIQGNNEFNGSNKFEEIFVNSISAKNISIDNNLNIQNLSVNSLSINWNNLFHINGYSLFNLSSDLSNKIFIDDKINHMINKSSDLSIIKIKKNDYEELLYNNPQLCSNVLYIIESDYIDTYGQSINNVIMSSDNLPEIAKYPSEATNKNYVDYLNNSLSSNLSTDIDKLSSNLSTDIDKLSTNLSTDIDKLSSNLSTDILSLSNLISNDVENLSSNLINNYYNKTLLSTANEINAALNKKLEYNPFKTISIIKPYCEEKIFVKLYISTSPEFNDPTIVNSKLENKYFYGLLNSDNDISWIIQPTDGFPREYNNSPVMVKLEEIFNDYSITYSKETIFYIKYEWYYIDLNLDEHISDKHSIVIPTNTEVGANNNDSIGKKEFYDIKQRVIPDIISVGLDDEYGLYYSAYPTQYCIISSIIDSNSKILLNDYSKNNTYRIQFNVGEQSLSIPFYINYGNGPEYDPELNINSNWFEKNQTYYIDIKFDHIYDANSNKLYYELSSSLSSKINNILNNEIINTIIEEFNNNAIENISHENLVSAFVYLISALTK